MKKCHPHAPFDSRQDGRYRWFDNNPEAKLRGSPKDKNTSTLGKQKTAKSILALRARLNIMKLFSFISALFLLVIAEPPIARAGAVSLPSSGEDQIGAVVEINRRARKVREKAGALLNDGASRREYGPLFEQADELDTEVEEAVFLHFRTPFLAEGAALTRFRAGDVIAAEFLEIINRMRWDPRDADRPSLDEYLARLQRSGGDSVVPNVDLRSEDGVIIPIVRRQGEVLVIDFWYTFCGPCVDEFPALSQLIRDYRGRAVRFVSVTPESSLVIKHFQRHGPLPFNHNVTDAQEVIDAFEIRGYPTHIIIDGEGRVVERFGSDKDMSRVRRTLESLNPPAAKF